MLVSELFVRIRRLDRIDGATPSFAKILLTWERTSPPVIAMGMPPGLASPWSFS